MTGLFVFSITSVFCCALSLTLMCSALLQKNLFEEDEVWQKFFKHTSIYCHACQKVCHLPSSAALLHKLTSDDDFD